MNPSAVGRRRSGQALRGDQAHRTGRALRSGQVRPGDRTRHLGHRPRPAFGAMGATAALLLVSVLGAGALTGCGAGSRADAEVGVGTGAGARAGAAGAGGSAAEAAEKPRLAIGDAFVPEPVTADMAAGFCTIANTGGADTLLSVSSDLAARVTLHTTQDGRMGRQGSFAVPAHGRLDLTRGANHLMFEKLTHRPRVGERVSLRLRFQRSGTLTVEVPVRPATYYPNAGTAGAHSRPPDHPAGAPSS